MGETQRVVHCRFAEPHDTHTWQGGTVDQGAALCPGGPWTGPGSTNRGAAGDQVVLDLLAAQWRKRRLAENDAPIGTSLRTFQDDSYRFARDALEQLKRAGVEMMVVGSPDDVQPPPTPGGWQPGTT
jgi:hypothetical protein